MMLYIFQVNNTNQMIITSSCEETYVMFIYDKLMWPNDDDEQVCSSYTLSIPRQTTPDAMMLFLVTSRCCLPQGFNYLPVPN